MNKTFIGLLLFSLLVYACSFNKMFMFPDKLSKENFHKKYYDVAAGDTMNISIDSLYNPYFARSNGKMYEYPFESRNVFFTSKTGNKLQGWIFTPKPETSNGISILFLHGNAGNILSHVTIIKPFVEKGFSVFIFDYSGFGISEGKADRKHLPDDAEAALNFFLGQSECKGKKVLLYGQSLGGHLALEVARKNQSKLNGVVVEGAFTNHDEIGSTFFKPGFIAKMFIREFYNGIKNIRKIKIPIMVAHSINDETIPYKMGEKLFENANIPKQFFKMEKCHVCGPIHYTDSLTARIQKMIIP